jgi:biofilm PGA synthesis N-glycosyltransferase PgaC
LSRPKSDITVSIGIPAYNEEGNIGYLLNNLLSQELSPPFKLDKIIVVASGCTDRTVQIVEEFREKINNIEIILEKERRGKSSALNLIFERVKTDLIVLMGADVLPRKGSIKRLLQPFSDESIGGVSSHPIPINSPNGFANSASCLIWDLHDLISSGSDVKLTGECFGVRNGLIHRIFSNINCDDVFIEFLIKKRNYRIIYAPTAIVDIKGPSNLRDLIAQRRRIHVGHQQIREITGNSVKTASIRENLKVLIKIFRKYYRNKWFLPIILTEILARVLGSIDYSRRNYQFIWQRIDSTKNLEMRR